MLIVTEICLSTGARWSEAEGLTWSQIGNNSISFERTKSGKSRSLPITNNMKNNIEQCRKKDSLPSDRIFCSCYSAFRKAVERSGLTLPPGQLSHVLRHTFASHFMMEGGNILILQKALGHASLQMTMRYAHFSPDHLEEVAKLTPLSVLTIR
jgi:integrase